MGVDIIFFQIGLSGGRSFLNLFYVMALIDDIESFCAAHGVSEARFGVAAMNDKHFVKELRAGRDVMVSTFERIREFIESGGEPDPGAAGVPAPDGAVWPTCGHPKTPANTQHIGKSGDRCRICRRRITRHGKHREREREKSAREKRESDRLKRRKRING